MNKYRRAIEILNRGRDLLVDALADEVIDQADDLLENGFLFHELLESQGTRLHFLSLLIAQLEQSAEAFEELQAITELPPPVEPAPPKKRRRSRSKKLERQASAEGKADDA
ncbi:MAG: hypothetical protein IRY99_18500 [Isosphaeraceae bacterium]|nr:hypothetical protein [Isosphaeraceae bacterium]